MTRIQRLAPLLLAWFVAAVFTVLGHAVHSLTLSWVGGLWAGAALVFTLLYREIRR